MISVIFLAADAGIERTAQMRLQFAFARQHRQRRHRDHRALRAAQSPGRFQMSPNRFSTVMLRKSSCIRPGCGSTPNNSFILAAPF